MNGTNEILDELRSLSAAVAAINRQTPYQAPEGYFTGLSIMVLRRVADKREDKSLIYNVPEGYFDGFAQRLLTRLKAGGSQAIAGSTEEAAVPADAAGDPVSAILAQIGRMTPYQAPYGYFEELSPLLTVVRDKNPRLVPEGYFESLPEVVMARIEQPAVSTVVSLGSRSRRSLSWMKYSAAAVMAGLILTIGWLRWHNAGNGSKTAGELANLSKVSDTELQNFLTDQDTTLAQPLSNTTATIDMNDTDLKTLLGDVPDGELKQYMEEHGGANDIATN